MVLFRILYLVVIGMAVSPVCEAATLHVLIAVDSHDEGIGLACEADGKSVAKVFRSNVAFDQLSLLRIDADDPASITNALSRLSVAADDTVCFFFSGHGYYDQGGQKFFCSKTQQSISRDRVRELLKDTGARLTVLLSDCCFNFYGKIKPGRPPMTSPPPRDTTEPVFDALFFEPSGQVDMTSSGKDELSLTYRNPQKGSVFTSQFVAYLNEHRDKRPTWQNLFDQVSQKTESISRSIFAQQTTRTRVQLPNGSFITQTKHTPMHFGTLPGGTSMRSNQPRFGVITTTGRCNGVTGAVIQSVLPGSPADGLSLKAGDGIIEVNGSAIMSREDFQAAVKQSPRRMTLMIGRSATGTFMQENVTLAR